MIFRLPTHRSIKLTILLRKPGSFWSGNLPRQDVAVVFTKENIPVTEFPRRNGQKNGVCSVQSSDTQLAHTPLGNEFHGTST